MSVFAETLAKILKAVLYNKPCYWLPLAQIFQAHVMTTYAVLSIEHFGGSLIGPVILTSISGDHLSALVRIEHDMSS